MPYYTTNYPAAVDPVNLINTINKCKEADAAERILYLGYDRPKEFVSPTEDVLKYDRLWTERNPRTPARTLSNLIKGGEPI